MLLSADNGYKFYKIEDVNQFRRIRPLLITPITEMQDKLLSIRTANDLLEEADGKLALKDRNFGLWLITDNNDKIIFALTTAILLNENYELCCYISGRYFKTGMMRKLTNTRAFEYLEEWAKERQCFKMMFITGRNPKAYARLLSRIGLKPTETIFVKELHYG